MIFKYNYKQKNPEDFKKIKSREFKENYILKSSNWKRINPTK